MMFILTNTKLKAAVSGTCMFLILAWLTVSLPYINEAKLSNKSPLSLTTGDNPLAGTTEEKIPHSPTVNFNQEYLHHNDHDFSLIPFQISIAFLQAHESTYTAYHGEPFSPPPNYFG